MRRGINRVWHKIRPQRKFAVKYKPREVTASFLKGEEHSLVFRTALESMKGDIPNFTPKEKEKIIKTALARAKRAEQISKFGHQNFLTDSKLKELDMELVGLLGGRNMKERFLLLSARLYIEFNSIKKMGGIADKIVETTTKKEIVQALREGRMEQFVIIKAAKGLIEGGLIKESVPQKIAELVVAQGEKRREVLETVGGKAPTKEELKKVRKHFLTEPVLREMVGGERQLKLLFELTKTLLDRFGKMLSEK